MTPPTVRQALAQSSLVPVDGQVLLAHVLGRDRAWLIAHAGDPLSREDADRFFALARRRREGEPVAYLTGWREFWGLRLAVDPSVLIPRPETETLAEVALARLPADRALRVLDLGTGSGAIALAIASERPLAQVVATDRSPAALAVARANAQRLCIVNVAFAQGDWYEALPPEGSGGFDLIASNPPYVAAGDAHLREGDLRFEPIGALAAGDDGLDALRSIVAGAPVRLAPGGWLAVEHGYDQSGAVQRLFADAGFQGIVPARDLAGIPRVVAGRRA
ncbi:MAG TPA: peptide chain release factor N(5)-glutamine methyltransferase [Casimicrobiaceae bacterium]|nr:peptide chain release factor N(5)-glutamine methyltransferase [Casimicrobiaceae bacterium]